MRAVFCYWRQKPLGSWVYISRGLFLDDIDSLNGNGWGGAITWITFWNGGEGVIPVNEFPVDGVAVVQMGSWNMGDEKLTAIGAWSGVGHGQ